VILNRDSATPVGVVNLSLRRRSSDRLVLNASRLEASAVSLVTVLGVASGLTQAHAGSGFVLRSQSTTLLGSAQAGMMTESDNASLIVNNPASLGWGNGREAVFGGTPIFTAAHFRDGVADTLLGTPISGGDGGNNGTKTFLPNLYAATDVAPAFRVGLGVTSLYGLSSTWQPGWLGRYYSISSQLVTYDILPTLSYRPNQSLSVGIAPIVQFARAKSTTAIDFGTIDQITLGGLGGGRPGLDDGSVSTRTSVWSAGVQVGAIFEALPGTRIGAAYRSQIRRDLQGTAQYQTGGPVGDAVAATTGAFTPGNIRLNLSMPPTATTGVSQQIGDAVTIMADLQWIGWRTLQGLTITSENPSQPPATTVLDWHNSWFFAAGLRYRIDEEFSLRLGAAYDQTPTRSNTRTPLIPDADSYWAAVGLEWHISPTVSLEAAYGHIFVTTGAVSLSASAPGNASRGSLAGNISGGSVDYLSMQIVSRF
jgi:long-chain fatty acid transport protein